MDKVSSRLKTAQAGLTLPEILVGFGLLGLLSLIIFLTLQTSRTAQRKHSERADMNTRQILARMKILDTLRGARLLVPTTEEPESQILRFQKPRFEDGLQMVDLLGAPLWGNTETIKLGDGGVLQYSNPNEGRVTILAKLGDLGHFHVRREKPFVIIKLTFQDTVEKGQEKTEVKAHIPLEVVLGSSSFGL